LKWSGRRCRFFYFSSPFFTGLSPTPHLVFALSFNAKDSSVKAVLGNGQTPRKATLENARAESRDGRLPLTSPCTVTTPGAVAGWCALLEHFGSKVVDLGEILEPAITLAERGFPVAPLTAHQWKESEQFLREATNGETFLVHGSAPTPGCLFTNPDLARTLREIARHGKDAFYSGRVAESIVATLQPLGGVMDLEDLAACSATVTDAICSSYRSKMVYQVPPPTQGATVLLALNILEEFDIKSLGPHSSPCHLHVVADALRIAYSDAAAFIADPRHAADRADEMLNKDYAKSRAKKLMSGSQCVANPLPGLAPGGTVQFCVVDRNGNAVSAVQSNYVQFGTGHGGFFVLPGVLW
jgi:gamma-glutamyltranspeptidase / glutathione hydrolase